MRLGKPTGEEYNAGPDQKAQCHHFHSPQRQPPLGVRIRIGPGERLREGRASRARQLLRRIDSSIRGWYSKCHHTIIHQRMHRHRFLAPSRCGPATERAVLSRASSEWESSKVAEQIPAVTVKTDGRKRRWHQHKVERRNELVDGTIEAIRGLGRNLSMDEIAAEIGVSKTVLYRYFVDKNDLTTAVMMRFAQTTLIPNMAAALSSNLDGYDLTREVIRVYVDTVAAEPEPYRLRDGQQLGQQEQSNRRLRADHCPHDRGNAAPPDE